MGTSAAQKRLFFNLKKMKKRLERVDDAAQLTPQEISLIAHDLNVSEQEVVDMDQRMGAHDQHLNARIGHDGDGQWMDMLADPSDSQETLLGEAQEYREKKDLMAEALESLNKRERDIIVQRRLTEDPITLEDLSHQYNISRERVRQIEARALDKMTKYVMAAASAPALTGPQAGA